MDVSNLDIKRIYETDDLRDVNNFLKKGWKLISQDHFVSDGKAKTHYCLVWLNEFGEINLPELSEISIYLTDILL